jgi:hypothetical protein
MHLYLILFHFSRFLYRMSNAVNPILLIGGSLACIVGQAWNVAIQEGINLHYPDRQRDTFRAKLLYALIVTIIITIIAIVLDYTNRSLTNDEKKFETSHKVYLKSRAYAR